MGKRIVLVPQTPEGQRPVPVGAADETWEPGRERRVAPRRSGLPRRVQTERRRRETYGLVSRDSSRPQRRVGVRRQVNDRRRRRDRRFGLDPTLYDRLGDLDL